ncbi:xanthine dehydrogenase family protein molybdopterin-binding subunit [Nostoc ellipsosporum NOK]|nr:xanthine dehydrogenase family protein molybdopterin-binding subunit [Nostoc ellipsosporum NOK]
MGNYFFETDGPIDRVDGKQKVTGKALYAAEYPLEKLCYGVLVSSSIARGSITAITAKEAENAPGVLAVITHLNRPAIPGYTGEGDTGPAGMKLLSGPTIYFAGQPVALVIADTFERAQHAASLVKVAYKKSEALTDLSKQLSKAAAPRRGKSEYTRGESKAYKKADVWIEEEYEIPHEVHNPMEPGSITAAWEGDQLTVYDKTQGVKASQRSYAQLFGVPQENVRVIAPFVGGGFGMALRTWPYEVAAVMGARKVGRPLKLMISRSQMFTLVGYRPHTIQQLGIGATRDGILTGISHDATAATASYEEFTEGVVRMTQFMYNCPNVDTRYRLVPLDVSVPTWMRGPGEATGAFALESAIDELAYKLDIDALDLRKKNYAYTDPESGLPYSSKFLMECYDQGAEKIGWYKRSRQPRSMKNGEWLEGYGMSSGVFGAHRPAATARAVLKSDGTLLVQSAASDIGPGTGTAMVKIAADVLGLPYAKVRFELGDSRLPPAPTQGGSGTNSGVGAAVHDVCTAVKEKLIAALPAGKEWKFDNGRVFNDSESFSLQDVIKKTGQQEIDLTRDSKSGEERQKYAFYSFSVHFTRLWVHARTGVVRIRQIVTVADAGKIVSEKTARSQMVGGAIGGIGMALMEEAVFDHRFGKMVNNNFADYHIPVNADVPDIDTIFINKPDPYINPMGAKGMGEIALIGYAASVTNAIYHATGKRIRTLPVTPDKLI